MEATSGANTAQSGTTPQPAVTGSSMSALWESALNEAAGVSTPPPTKVEPKVESKPEPKATESSKSEPPAEADDEFEYEGKKYKVEKTAKEYAKDLQNAMKGMRKAFSERDSQAKKFKENEANLIRYNQIMDAWKVKGVDGLYDSIAGKEGAYKEELAKRDQLTLRKYNATESELKAIEREEALDREIKARQQAESILKQTHDQLEAEKTEANKAVLTTRLGEAFDLIDFEGKLGDPEQEAEFNQYVWEKARVKLKEYADSKGLQHHEIPSRVIKSTFTDIAARLDKTIKGRAATEVKQQAQDASDVATKMAQSKSISNPSKEANTLDQLVEKHSSKWNANAFLKDLFGQAD